MTSETLSIIEAILTRRSVRTFGGDNFPEAKKLILNQIIEEVNQMPTPFNSEGVEVDITKPGIGRLKFISNETGWLVEKILKIDNSHSKEEKTKEERKQEKAENLLLQYHQKIDVSFRQQIAVIKMQQNNISTVWVGGTYNESLVESRFDNKYSIPCVAAYGIENSPHLVSRVIKKVFSGTEQKRASFEALFFDGDKNAVIKEKDVEGDENKKLFLQCLRSGPSALNQQSWRFILKVNEVHLFDSIQNDTSVFECGIALANLFLLKEIRGGSVEFKTLDPAPKASPLGGKYVMTAIYKE